jgi:hypothetical protein
MASKTPFDFLRFPIVVVSVLVIFSLISLQAEQPRGALKAVSQIVRLDPRLDDLVPLDAGRRSNER